VKRPGREAAHSPQTSAEVKNAWNYASIPPHATPQSSTRDKFTFTFTYSRWGQGDGKNMGMKRQKKINERRKSKKSRMRIKNARVK
jgi:hypothetical protein